ncbi:MAG TPA: Fe-S cluster assembly ATPase SufC [Candidatus Nanoarchaeia archaeon]|nr:Fe-S cluster assembly ATPase SufC [Candidatus Nanoarchaeia archaeon]
MTLEIADLHVAVEGKEILKGLTLQVKSGQIVALMGPNGSGKSTLAYTLMGHPKYVVTKGHVTFEGKDLLVLKPDARARAGLFLSFQYPAEVAGVTVANFLRLAVNAKRESQGKKPLSVIEFQKSVKQKMDSLKMDHQFLLRHLNEGFSGGEKKRMEILQMAMLEPKMAVLDETDSGLDIDALKAVAMGINALLTPELGVLIITHYQRILNYIKPNTVHVMKEGRIVKSGGPELVEKLEQQGYDWV